MNSSAMFDRVIGSRWLRFVGVVCLVLIVVLSLIPGQWQVRTHFPGPVEHFVAYFGTAVILGMGARSARFPIFLVVMLCGLSGLWRFFSISRQVATPRSSVS
jgi:hypothetical protein